MRPLSNPHWSYGKNQAWRHFSSGWKAFAVRGKKEWFWHLKEPTKADRGRPFVAYGVARTQHAAIAAAEAVFASQERIPCAGSTPRTRAR